LKPIHITSRDNSLLRRVRAVRDGKIDELIFVEGLRLCEEALSSGLKIDAAIYSEELARKDRAASLISELSNVANKTATVSEKLLASISYTRTPQGIIVLSSRPAIEQTQFKTQQPVAPLLVIMHGINNPVNVGAILRTAEAAGATGAITTANTSNPFSPKALRGAMGSAFRLPIWMGPNYSDVVTWCDETGIRTICAALDGQETHTEVNWRGPCALILGPESSGLSSAELAGANQVVRVPMRGAVESLNVAVAAGVLLYEAARQRGP